MGRIDDTSCTQGVWEWVEYTGELGVVLVSLVTVLGFLGSRYSSRVNFALVLLDHEDLGPARRIL